jgi:hypothetical protein
MRVIPVLLVLLSSFATAQILAPERRTIWTPGIPGGIPEIAGPVRSVLDHGADPTGVKDNKAAFDAALAALPTTGGVLMVPKGKYRLASTWVVRKNNVVVRGEGHAKSELLFDHASDGIQIRPSGSDGTAQTVSGFAKGSRTVTVTDGTAFQAGDFVKIDQKNDSAKMYTEPAWNETWAADAVGQVFEVASVSGNKLTFKSAVHYPIRSDLSPRIRKIAVVRGVGFEALKVARLQKGTHSLTFKSSAYCWVRRVESWYGHRTHIQVSGGIGFEARENFVHRSFSYGNGGQGYGIELGWQATDALVENNVFDSLRHAMMVHVGVVGSVFGYNHAERNLQGEGETNLNSGWIPPDISIHGHWAQMNLFEGNSVQEIGISDYWGPMGPGNTYARNVVRGEGIFLYDHSDDQNLVGNVSTKWTDDGTSKGILRHGEKVGSSTTWASGITDRTIPASYYLATRPAWWTGSLSWPSMGSDVASSRNPAELRFDAGAPIPLASTVSVRRILETPAGFVADARLVAPDGRVVRSWTRAIRPMEALRDLRGLPAGVYLFVGWDGVRPESRRVEVTSR